MNKTKLILIGSACFSAGWAAPAWSQEAATPAQNAEAGGGAGLDEIVVTAQRREESLQKVALSASAFGAKALAEGNFRDIQALSVLTPSLQIINGYDPGRPSFAVRGQVQTNPTVSNDTSVGVYQDEVYLARSTGSIVDLLDVSNVQVLNGPQGTLFGKNTTGGAVVVTSNKPTNEFGGWIGGGYERFDGKNVKGVLNIPLVDDKLAIRGAGLYSSSDGFSTNFVTGNKINRRSKYFGRLSLLAKPTERMEIVIRGDMLRGNFHGTGSRIIRYTGGLFSPATINAGLDPRVNSLTPTDVANIFFPGGDPTLAIPGLQTALDFINGQIAAGMANPYVNGQDVRILTGTLNPDGSVTGGHSDAVNHSRNSGVSATINYDLGGAQLRSITAYRKSSSKTVSNLDGIVLDQVDGIFNQFSKQFSQEFLLSGDSFSDRFHWTVGGLYFNEKTSALLFYDPLPWLQLALGGAPFLQNGGSGRNISYAGYGQGTFDITSKLSLTLGGRYTIDKRALTQAGNYSIFQDGTRVCALAPVPPNCINSVSKTFKKFTYTAGLQYQFTPDVMAYIHRSRGYRAGGFAADSIQGFAFGPEVVDDTEIGVKAEWLDRRLRTNVSFFNTKAKGVQQSITTLDEETNKTTGRVINTGQSRVNGVDATITLRAFPWLTVSNSTTYLDTKFKAAPGIPTFTYPFTKLYYSPKWQNSVSATVSGEVIPSLLSASAQLSYLYRADMIDASVVRSPDGTPVATHYGHKNLVNLNINFVHMPSKIELSVYARNLLNARYYDRTISTAGLGYSVGFDNEPRVLGFDVKIPFGNP